MACTHLRKLYQLCQEQQLYFSASDLVHIICKECEAEEVCPTSLTFESTKVQSEVEDQGTKETTT